MVFASGHQDHFTFRTTARNAPSAYLAHAAKARNQSSTSIHYHVLTLYSANIVSVSLSLTLTF